MKIDNYYVVRPKLNFGSFLTFEFSIKTLKPDILANCKIWHKKPTQLTVPSFLLLFSLYSPGHKCWPKTSWAGIQGNHQNFDPSLLPKKHWLLFKEWSKNIFLKKKNPKWPTQKKLILPNGQFSTFFCQIEWDGSLG